MFSTFSEIFKGNIADVHDNPEHDLGTIAFDKSGNKYIYLAGVASTVAGDVVAYDEDYATTRAGANAVGGIAVALGAVIANKYGFYQIGGKATVNVATGFAADTAVYLTSTAGTIDDAAVAGDQINGAIGRSAIGTPASGQAYVQLIGEPYVDNVDAS